MSGGGSCSPVDSFGFGPVAVSAQFGFSDYRTETGLKLGPDWDRADTETDTGTFSVNPQISERFRFYRIICLKLNHIWFFS